MRNLSEEQVDHYLDLDAPLDCAGGPIASRSRAFPFLVPLKRRTIRASSDSPLLRLSREIEALGLKVLSP